MAPHIGCFPNPFYVLSTQRIMTMYNPFFMEYNLYTDGGSVNYGDIGMIGVWAFSLRDEEQVALKSGVEVVGGDNNRMELMAVTRGLAHSPDGSRVNIYSDSLHVGYIIKRLSIESAKSQRGKGDPKRKILRHNRDVWRAMQRLLRTRTVSFNQVHSDTEQVPEHQRMHDLCCERRAEYVNALRASRMTVSD